MLAAHHHSEASGVPALSRVNVARRDLTQRRLCVAAALAQDSVRALVRGMLQLAPDARMTCGAAMDHLFFATRLAPVVLVAVADRGALSVVQGKLEPQLLEWLQTDPYWIDNINALRDQPASKRSRITVGSVERPHIFEEGGYTGYEPPSRSKSRLQQSLGC